MDNVNVIVTAIRNLPVGKEVSPERKHVPQLEPLAHLDVLPLKDLISDVLGN